MTIEKNVGIIDRVFRAAFGTAFLAGGVLYLVGIPLFISIFIGVFLLTTAFASKCPVYHLLGLSTYGSSTSDLPRKKPAMEKPPAKKKARKKPKKRKK